MANKRISELTSITGANLADADLLVVVDVSDPTMAASGTNKKITMAELAKDSALTDNLIAKTTLTTDGDVLTRAAGVPDRITRADLAQDSAFSSRYVAKTDNDEVFIPVSDFLTTAGTPNVGTVAGMWAGLNFDDATSERIGIVLKTPGHWTTLDIDVYWRKATANSGDVVFYRSYERATSTSYTLGSGGIAGSITAVAAPAASTTYAITTLATGQNAPTGANDLASLWVGRTGGDAADTLTGDITIFGVLLRKAS